MTSSSRWITTSTGFCTTIPANIASVQKEHEQILGYLRDGLPLDVDVEALFEHHLGMYRENFQKILERFPDFFVRT